MRIFIYRYLVVCLIIAALGLNATSAIAGQDYGTDELVSDVLTGVVPLTGLAVAVFTGDTEGQKQWLRNTGVNQVLTSALRLGFNETYLGKRPNGSGYGFPSGHEAFVMSGATFLGQRYGWKWGVPAYLAAAYVARVRVVNNHHHVQDVVASAALAYGVALLTITSEHATHLAPVIGPHFLGLRWQRSF
jgi:membrane-associated phospholipid phosphatase